MSIGPSALSSEVSVTDCHSVKDAAPLSFRQLGDFSSAAIHSASYLLDRYIYWFCAKSTENLKKIQTIAQLYQCLFESLLSEPSESAGISAVRAAGTRSG